MNQYKIYIIIACLVLAVAMTWRVLDWRSEAYRVPILEKELEDLKKVPAQIIEKCEQSKEPAKEANNYEYTNVTNSLNLCLNQLRKLPTKCVPIARPTNSTDSANQSETSGITESAIEANNIECQADRDALNAARIWAVGYQKYKESYGVK